MEEKAVGKIIDLVSNYSNVDFNHYKISSLLRRIEKRLLNKELGSAKDYLHYLEKNVDEIVVLYTSLMIGVTSFFRDPEAFDVMEKTVIPEICKNKGDHDVIRIWVAGCSTGEEAFSIAILFEEYITVNKLEMDYKIFATDLDPRAVEYAGIARYPATVEDNIRPDRLNKYFKKIGDFYDINKSIRKKIIFVRHNILKDPPFIRLDLVTCRNLFIYLKSEAQKRILWDFHYSLRQNGFLLLGHNESMDEPDQLFTRRDAKWKIYQNKPGQHFRQGNTRDYTPAYDLNAFNQSLHKHHADSPKNERYAELLAERYAPPCLIVNSNNDLVYTNGGIERYLQLPDKKVSLNIFKLVSKELALIFRNGLRKIKESRSDVVFKDVKIHGSQEEIQTNVYFRRLQQWDGERFNPRNEMLILVEIQGFRKETDAPKTVETYRNDISSDHIKSLERELELTKLELNYTIQEVETINEELQASNEEMMSANEELQSTNEEMQSSNEELFTVNMELKSKVNELTVLNNDVNNLFKSTDIAIIFLDEHLNIRKFTPAVKTHFNLLDTDLGRPIGHLSANFYYDGFVNDSGKVLQNLQPEEREIENFNGHIYLIRILPYKTEDMHVRGVVITFVDVTVIKTQTREIAQKNDKLQKINTYLDDFVYTIAHDLRSPIANMMVYVELIKETDIISEKAEYIAKLDNIIHRMDSTMRGLIEIIDTQSNVSRLVKKINLNDLFEKVKIEFDESLELSGARIETEFEVTELQYIEPFMLSIVRNLLSNSIKYRSVERPLRITFKTRQRKQFVEMIFEDNGIGIDTDKFNQQLFKPFKRFNWQPREKVLDCI